MFVHQLEELGGVARCQADAAVGSRLAQQADGAGAVEGRAAMEEHRMRHGRVLVLARVVHS